MLRKLVKATPIATVILGVLDLTLPFVLFNLSAETNGGPPPLRLGFLSYRDAILIVTGTLSFTVLFGGIWAVSTVHKVSRIVREGRETTEAIQKERARAVKRAAPTKTVRRKKSKKARG